MTSAPITTDRHPSTVAATGSPDPPRLELKPTTTTPTGQVDGAWWPRSRDLALELRALIPTLVGRLGRVERIGYHLRDWDPTVRTIAVDGALVRVAGYHHQRAHTIDVLAERHRITLLVLPVDGLPEQVRSAMAIAARPGNADTVGDLLSAPVA